MSEALPIDIQTALQNDASGQYRARLLRRLAALQDDCAGAKRRLNDRETFLRLQAAEAAVESAIRIVETFGKSRGRKQNPHAQ